MINGCYDASYDRTSYVWIFGPYFDNFKSTCVWGYFGYRFDYGVSGVCTRYMRRYGSIRLVCSLRMLDELTAGRRACMS